MVEAAHANRCASNEKYEKAEMMHNLTTVNDFATHLQHFEQQTRNDKGDSHDHHMQVQNPEIMEGINFHPRLEQNDENTNEMNMHSVFQQPMQQAQPMQKKRTAPIVQRSNCPAATGNFFPSEHGP